MSGLHPVRWVCAVLMAMAVAVPVTATAVRFAGWERSTWIRIVLAGDRATPPPLRVVYGDDAAQVLPVIWEASARNTLLGLKTTGSVRLLGIETDRGAVPPWLAQTWAPGWERVTDPPALRLRGPGVIDALGTFQRFTLTFEASPAVVDVGWLDQYETIDLGRYPGAAPAVTLTRPTAQLGWVLLPPTAIDRIAIRRDPQAGVFSLREVTVRGTPQSWSARSTPGRSQRGVADCAVTPIDGALRVEGSSVPCDVALTGLGALNRVSLAARLTVWVVLTATGVAVLLGVAASAARVRRSGVRQARAEARSGRWLEAGRGSWTMARVVVAVTSCAILYHLSYVVSVPPQFNFDSLGYYAFGRNLLHTGSLDAVGTCRTPGYPAAIALSIFLFGDQIQALVLAQHLALCALGAAVVWFLYPRVGPLWAGTAGLLAGVSPIMSIAANIVWTETLFLVLSTGALLLFLRSPEPRPRLLLAAGVMAGAATLVRPNGIVVVALMIGWIVLQWWCEPPSAPGLRRLMVPAGIVAAGAAAVTAPWLLHFHRVTGHWGLSDASCSQEEQTHTTVAAGAQATNIFQLAGFVNLISQNEDVAALAITEPHRVFFRFFPARHRYYAGRFLPGELTYDDRFTGEVFREYLRVFPGTYLRQVGDALVFNLTHAVLPRTSIFPYPDLEDAVRIARTSPHPGAPTGDTRAAALRSARTITWPEAQLMLDRMIPWAAPASALRSWHLTINRTAMTLWPVVTMAGLCGGLICLLLPAFRGWVVLAWHALILSAAPAVLAMGADRYAMVAEPAFYVLAAVLLSFVVQPRVRRVAEPAAS